MSAERDELRELINELPDEQVPAVLADVRRHLVSTPAGGQWPPTWIGSISAGRSDVGRNHDDLLAEGFGHG